MIFLVIFPCSNWHKITQNQIDTRSLRNFQKWKQERLYKVWIPLKHRAQMGSQANTIENIERCWPHICVHFQMQSNEAQVFCFRRTQYICVIPKPGKNHRLCANYHPISDKCWFKNNDQSLGRYTKLISCTICPPGPGRVCPRSPSFRPEES